MSKVKILAGDFCKGVGSFQRGSIVPPIDPVTRCQHIISLSSVVSIEIVNDRNIKKIGASLGWGVAGGVALGPLGMLAGLIAGGNQKTVTFIGYLNDERKFLAETDSKTYSQILAATM